MVNARASQLSSRRQNTALLATLLTAVFTPALSCAAVDTWNAAISANFSTGPWSPSLPGSLDTAFFSLNSTYAVTFDTSPTNASFAVVNGAVTWMTNGSAKTYTVTANSSITGGSLALGTSAAGLSVNLSGALSINGAATPLLNVAGTNNLTTGNLSLGSDGIVGHSGTITDTSNITLSGASTLTVGAATNSTGNLTLSAGSFTTGTGLTTVNATGQINISGGTFSPNADITLTGGGTLNQTGGVFNWAASHTLTIQNLAKVNLFNSYTTPTSASINVSGIGSQLTDGPSNLADFAINNGAQLNVTSGALVSASGFFDIASVGNGSVVVDGAGSSLVIANSSNFLGTVGIGTLTVRNNATATSGGFSFGISTGSSGTLNVQSNATLTTGTLNVGTTGAVATAAINLSNATINMTGAAALNVGSASFTTASISIFSGTFNTGTGITTINTTGLVNITGGTFNVNGNINVNGGNLTQTNTGVFALAPGRTMTIQNLGKVNVSGIYSTPANAIINVIGAGALFNDPDSFANIDISNGCQLTVTSGADVSTGRLFNVGITGNGTAIFDGAGSTLTAPFTSGQSDTVGNGGNGTLTFRNNAFGNFQTGLVVGVFGGNGTFNVQSGATINATSLTIGLIGGSIGNANITGGSVNLTGGLSVGTAGAAASTLTIGTGGSLVTGGAALTEVDAPGLININGGTLLANGNITVFGGTLTQTDASAINGFIWNPFRTFAVLSGGKANFAGIFTTPAAVVINVSGAGSQFNNTPDNIHFQVALQLENDAQLNVSNGGAVSAVNILQIGNTNGNASASFSDVGTSLNVVGAIYVGGSGVGSLTITNGAAATTGGLTLGNTTLASAAGAVNVTNGATLNAGSLFGTLIGPTGTLTITDSTVTLGNLTVNGGALIFNSGSLTYTGNLTVGFGGVLGTNLNLDFSRALTLSGTTTITPQHQLSLTGGSLSTAALINNGSFNFTAGTLAITGPAGLTIGAGGPLGASLSLASSQSLSVSNTTTIAPTGLLFLNGGNVIATGGLTNNGTIQFASPASSLTGNTITNNGTIQGTGFIAAPVNNSGTIEPTGGGGGNLLFTGPFNNTANGTLRTAPGTKLLFQAASFGINQGLISLAGGTLDNGGSPLNNIGQITGFGVLSTGGPGLGNNGNITFTGGTSTINGNVTNNANHTLNIKFQPAIFTGSVVNNANATIKTTSTTATFASSFLNFGSFLSDPATNIFQGPTLNAGLMSGGPGDVFTLDTFTNTGTFTNGGSLNANNNITNAATFSQSGPQFWSPGTSFTNTAGTATFASNAKLHGLTISAGTVDITNSKFIIETTTASKLTTLTALRHNVATHSLTSSTLPANLALALVDNAITNLPAFGNNPADSNSLLLSPELLGDANIDGHVDLTDINTILNHFGASTPNWTDGNFDHAATIDLTDLSFVLNNFGQTLASASAVSDGGASQNLAAAPEPSSLALLAISSLFMKKRRSRTA